MKKLCYILSFFLMPNLYGQNSFVLQNTNTATLLHALSFETDLLGYACCDSGVVIKTTDGGVTWTKLNNVSTNNLWDIKIFPNTNGQHILTIGDNNTIRRSKNGGTTWSSIASPVTSSLLFGIHIVDTNNFWIAGGDFSCFNGFVMNTTNGGTSWTNQCISNTGFLEELAWTNSSVGFVCGTDASNAGVIYKTVNSGATWTVAKTTSGLMNSVFAISPTKVISVGLNGEVTYSYDNGNTWVDIAFPGRNFYAVYFIDTLHGYMCGDDANHGVVYETIDGGINWVQLNYNKEWAWSVQRINNSIYVCGDKGNLAKMNVTPAASNIIESLSNFKVYPTPCTNELFIEGAGGEIKKLTISNLHGHQIKQMNVESDKIMLDTRNLSAGIYLLRVESKEGIQIRKFSKL